MIQLLDLKSRRLLQIALPALSVTLGMQLLRAFLPFLQYLLGDRFWLPPPVLGIVGLVIFGSAFYTNRLNSQWGLRRLLLVSAGTVGLARLLAQLWTGDPVIDMVLVTAGTVGFVLFLPAYLIFCHWQVDPIESSHRYTLSIFMGLTFDTTLHGVFLTYDLIWQAGLTPLLVSGGLVLVQGLALRAVVAAAPAHPAPVEGSLAQMWPWFAIGPFLLLELLILQNQSRLAAITGWSAPVAFGVVLTGHLLGLWVAAIWQPGRRGAAVMGMLLLAAFWPFSAGAGEVVVALGPVVGQLAAAVLIATILRGLGAHIIGVYYLIGTPQQPQEGIPNLSRAYGIGMVLLVALLFGYYITYSLPMPYQNSWLPMAAGLMIGVAAIGAATPQPEVPRWRRWTRELFMPGTLLLFPFYGYVTSHQTSPTVPNPGPIRVINYNVHSGVNAAGSLDLEGLATTIETAAPDVVTLQEISRGWVINGSVDMISWLSRRLDLPYIYYPASDPLFGLAILSRYPIVRAENYPLPPRNLPLNRGFTYAQIDIGLTEPLQLINAHLHHRISDSSIRVQQVEAVLEFIDNRPFRRIVFAGDLNAAPDAPEIEKIYAYGFQDVVITAGLDPGLTFHADYPFKRLDYVLVSHDLTPIRVTIPKTNASDHLPISATILPE